MDIRVTLNGRNSRFYIMRDITRILCFSYDNRKERELPEWFLKKYGPGPIPKVEEYLAEEEGLDKMQAYRDYLNANADFERRYVDFIGNWYDGALEKIILLGLQGVPTLGFNMEGYYSNWIPDSTPMEDVIDALDVIPRIILPAVCSSRADAGTIQGKIVVKGESAHAVIQFSCDEQKLEIAPPAIQHFAVPDLSGFKILIRKMGTDFPEAKNEIAYQSHVSYNGNQANFTFSCNEEIRDKGELEKALFRALALDSENIAPDFAEWSKAEFGYTPETYDADRLDMSLMHERKAMNIAGIERLFGSVYDFRAFMGMEEEAPAPSMAGPR